MRTLFSFPTLSFGILFFFAFAPFSNVLALSCGTGGTGTCGVISASCTSITDTAGVCIGATPVCCGSAVAPAATPKCPAHFVEKSGVCFPDASAGLGLSEMSVLDLITRVMNWLLGILGVLAVIAFVISGTQYLVSSGDEDMAETAKRNMTYAVVGLVIALAGLIIVNAIAGLLGAGGGTVVY